MPIEVDCPTCGQRHNVPYTQAGRTQDCAACGKPIRVPAPRALVASKAQRERTEIITPDDLFDWAYERVTSRLKWLISRPFRLVVLLVLLVACYLGIAAARWALREATAAATASRKSHDPDPWDSAGMSDTNGQVRVTAESVSVSKIMLLGQQRVNTFQSAAWFLVIALKIENLSPDQELQYSGWDGRAAATDQVATLTDNLGGIIKQYDGSEQIVGQIRSASIKPGESIKELLAFDSSRLCTRLLRLSLPAKALGGTGELRIGIPQETGGD
jgi:hypothetical protein